MSQVFSIVGGTLLIGSILSCAGARKQKTNTIHGANTFKQPPQILPFECNQGIRRRIVSFRIMLTPENCISRRRLLGSALSLWTANRLLAQKDSTFSTGVSLVNVFATVRDSKGRIVRNLAKEDFALSEDGHPQTIRYFSQESGLPLTLGLLVDTSMSQRRVLGKERDASYRFMEKVLRED